MAARDMNEGVATLFESFALRSEYEDAIEFINVCTDLIPTPFVVNDVIFKIMKNCDAKLANEGSAYMLNLLTLLSKDPNQNYDFERALKHPTGALPDVWSVLTYFVRSSLHHHDIPSVTSVLSDSDIVKSPNCDVLADFYVKVLTTCCDVKKARNILLKNHLDERLAQLLSWINQYYKFNIEQAMILQTLHNLLDYIVKTEVFDDVSIPVHMIVNKSSLSEIALLVLNTCKDVFVNPESQSRFFNNTSLPYLIVKVCHHKLNSMIREFITEEPEEVTLSTIIIDVIVEIVSSTTVCAVIDEVVDYIPYQVRRTQDVDMSSSSSSPRKSKRLKKFDEEPTPGDTELHEYCRTLKPADLLKTLFSNPRLDINTKNNAGNTPLHVACLAGSYHCVKFLIEDSGDRIPDFKATDNEGRMPLHCAVHANALDIAKFLLKRGGYELVVSEDVSGNKPIHYATSDEMKELLQKYETDLQLREQGDENDDMTLSFAPSLKDFNEFHLYLSTLRIMLINYCEIYDIPAIKQTSGGAIACHDSKECCHFVASAVNTLCLGDFSVMVDLPGTFERLIASLKLVELVMDIGDEVLLYEACAVGFD